MTKYQDLKARGAAKLQRLGLDTFQMVLRKFDPQTGQELPPEVLPMNRADLRGAETQFKAQMAAQQAAADACAALLAEMDALDQVAA